MSTDAKRRRSIGWELALVTGVLVTAAHGLMRLRGLPTIGPLVPTIVAVLFLYVPILVLWLRRRAVTFVDQGWRAYLRAARLFLITALIVFPPFFVGVHLWERIVWGHAWAGIHGIPDFWQMVGFQLLLVALPEEFYFRGYFQTAIDTLFPKRWRVLGVRLGWGWIITAGVFAVAHSLVTYRWWHFAIFFPALLFGYLRERTGTITAPILFHATANIAMQFIARSYV